MGSITGSTITTKDLFPVDRREWIVSLDYPEPIAAVDIIIAIQYQPHGLCSGIRISITVNLSHGRTLDIIIPIVFKLILGKK